MHPNLEIAIGVVTLNWTPYLATSPCYGATYSNLTYLLVSA